MRDAPSIPLNLAVTCRLHHIERNHHIVIKDDRVVRLDEAHATHVRSQVEHMVAALADFLAIFKNAQIHEVKLIAELTFLQAPYVKHGSEHTHLDRHISTSTVENTVMPLAAKKIRTILSLQQPKKGDIAL